MEGIDIMQISGHNNVAFINNYSTLSEERHKKISNILSNTESETNRNAFQQTYLVKPPQILQPVALLMFRVEAIPMFGSPVLGDHNTGILVLCTILV